VVNAALKKQPDDGHYLQLLNPEELSLERAAIAMSEGTMPGTEIRIIGGRFVVHAAGDRVVQGTILPDDAAIRSLPEFLDQYGVIPLPTYIGEERLAYDIDQSAYEVCYAHVPGSLACPTAGLHFTPALMRTLEAQGHQFVEITLHIGYGSWGSVQTAYVDDFDLDSEAITVGLDALQTLWQGKRDHRTIIAVGTTCVRTLESIAPEILNETQPAVGIQRSTSLFIHPPYQPRVVDALLTDFAFPQTPVMMMSAAFCGLDAIKRVYRTALDEGYMFDIFGDAFLIM
jgi:S-adenosylmethionine:tRNA ribosyltransferase-isomerase